MIFILQTFPRILGVFGIMDVCHSSVDVYYFLSVIERVIPLSPDPQSAGSSEIEILADKEIPFGNRRSSLCKKRRLGLRVCDCVRVCVCAGLVTGGQRGQRLTGPQAFGAPGGPKESQEGPQRETKKSHIVF